MGERATRLSQAPEDRGPPGDLEREISALRSEMGDLVGELDRRRREVMDVRLQIRRHPLAVSLAGLAVAVLVGGAVAALLRSSRRKRTVSYRARQLQGALRRILDHPERVGRGEPPAGERILAAIGSAAAAVLVKRAFERTLPRKAVGA